MARNPSKAYAELTGGGYQEDDREAQIGVGPLELELKQLEAELQASGIISSDDISALTGDTQSRINQLIKLSSEYNEILRRLLESNYISEFEIGKLRGDIKSKINYLLALENFKMHEDFYRAGTE